MIRSPHLFFILHNLKNIKDVLKSEKKKSYALQQCIIILQQYPGINNTILPFFNTSSTLLRETKQGLMTDCSPLFPGGLALQAESRDASGVF